MTDEGLEYVVLDENDILVGPFRVKAGAPVKDSSGKVIGKITGARVLDGALHIDTVVQLPPDLSGPIKISVSKDPMT